MTKQEANNRLNELWNSNIDLNDKNILKEINQLTAILYNDSEISNKSLIRIRIFSKNEYNKYVNLGTLDGSIIANDINVWHYTAYQEYFVGTGNFYISYDMLSDNITNTAVFCGKGSKFGTYAYDYRNWATMGTEYSISKTTNIYYDAARTSTGWESQYGRYSRGHISCSFRPVFQYKDTQKTENIFF